MIFFVDPLVKNKSARTVNIYGADINLDELQKNIGGLFLSVSLWSLGNIDEETRKFYDHTLALKEYLFLNHLGRKSVITFKSFKQGEDVWQAAKEIDE